MDEDDLLTPYKEVSYEIYEKRSLDSSPCSSVYSSYESGIDEENLPQIIRAASVLEYSPPRPPPPPAAPQPITHVIEPIKPPPIVASTVPTRKRGRPRKPRPPTPEPPKSPVNQIVAVASFPPAEERQIEETRGNDKLPDDDGKEENVTVKEEAEISEDVIAPSATVAENSMVDDTVDQSDEKPAIDESIIMPVVKKSRGRPRKTDSSYTVRKQLSSTLNCIIPEGTKRKSRPSRFLDDYDSCFPLYKTSPSSTSPKTSTPNLENGETVKRGRGRPRTRPPKVRILNPDGTPRGRGRPPTKHLLLASANHSQLFDESVLMVKKENSASRTYVKQEGMSIKSEENTSTNVNSMTTVNKNIAKINGIMFIKRPRGRPRKYPFQEKVEKFPKRVAGPGKKLGRPRKGEEKNPRIVVPRTEEKSDPTWKINWSRFFKVPSGARGPTCKTEPKRQNGVDKMNVSHFGQFDDAMECDDGYGKNQVNKIQNKIKKEYMPKTKFDKREIKTNVTDADASMAEEKEYSSCDMARSIYPNENQQQTGKMNATNGSKVQHSTLNESAEGTNSTNRGLSGNADVTMHVTHGEEQNCEILPNKQVESTTNGPTSCDNQTAVKRSTEDLEKSIQIKPENKDQSDEESRLDEILGVLDSSSVVDLESSEEEEEGEKVEENQNCSTVQTTITVPRITVRDPASINNSLQVQS